MEMMGKRDGWRRGLLTHKPGFEPDHVNVRSSTINFTPKAREISSPSLLNSGERKGTESQSIFRQEDGGWSVFPHQNFSEFSMSRFHA